MLVGKTTKEQLTEANKFLKDFIGKEHKFLSLEIIPAVREKFNVEEIAARNIVASCMSENKEIHMDYTGAYKKLYIS